MDAPTASIDWNGRFPLNAPSPQIGRVLNLVVKTGDSVLRDILMNGNFDSAMDAVEGDDALLRLVRKIDEITVNSINGNPITLDYLIRCFQTQLLTKFRDPIPSFRSKVPTLLAQDFLSTLNAQGQSIIDFNKNGQWNDLNDFFALCSSFFEAFERYHNFKDKAELDYMPRFDYKGDIPLVVDLERTVEIDQYHLDVIECILNGFNVYFRRLNEIIMKHWFSKKRAARRLLTDQYDSGEWAGVMDVVDRLDELGKMPYVVKKLKEEHHDIYQGINLLIEQYHQLREKAGFK